MRPFAPSLLAATLFLSGIPGAVAWAARNAPKPPARAKQTASSFDRLVRGLERIDRGRLRIHEKQAGVKMGKRGGLGSRLLHEGDSCDDPVVGRSFTRWPKKWSRDVTWATVDSYYFDERDRPGYEIKIPKGWRLMPVSALYLGDDGKGTENPLYQHWQQFYHQKGGKRPANQFDQNLMGNIEGTYHDLLNRSGGDYSPMGEQTLPLHSDFYKRFKIAGFYGTDWSADGRLGLSVIVLPGLGTQLKLRRAPRP